MAYNASEVINSHSAMSIFVSTCEECVSAGLAASNGGYIIASYAAGELEHRGQCLSSGGLVGYNAGLVAASYSTTKVTFLDSSSGGGGANPDCIMSTYYGCGGLVGKNVGGQIYASYSSGRVIGVTPYRKGGLAGVSTLFHYGVNYSYFDSTEAPNLAVLGVGKRDDVSDGKTTNQLQAPTGYTDIYSSWNVDVDNEDGDDELSTGGDDPWHFGTSGQYPVLKNIDANNDGVMGAEDLAVQRAELGDDGAPRALQLTESDPSGARVYPNPASGVCSSSGIFAPQNIRVQGVLDGRASGAFRGRPRRCCDQFGGALGGALRILRRGPHSGRTQQGHTYSAVAGNSQLNVPGDSALRTVSSLRSVTVHKNTGGMCSFLSFWLRLPGGCCAAMKGG